MIRNNLAILMSERGIKNSVLSMRTGISKNTISSTVQNDGKMIQLETINKICQALGVTPNEFFSYIPYDVEIKVDINDIEMEFSANDVYELDGFYITSIDLDLIVSIEKNGTIVETIIFETCNFFKGNLFFTDSFWIELETIDPKFEEIWSDIPTAFSSDIQKKILHYVQTEILSSLTARIIDSPHEDNLMNHLHSMKFETTAFQLGIPY